MGRGNVTGQELADLVERTAEAASALIRGDIRRYLTLIGRNDDYTLMAPSGGEPRHGFDASDQAVEALGDLVVLMAVERRPQAWQFLRRL
jgi:hypothetical protein